MPTATAAATTIAASAMALAAEGGFCPPDADRPAWAAFSSAFQKAAEELAADHGSCRLDTEAAARLVMLAALERLEEVGAYYVAAVPRPHLIEDVFEAALDRALRGGLIDAARYAEDAAFAERVNAAFSDAAYRAAHDNHQAWLGFDHQVEWALDSALADLVE